MRMGQGVRTGLGHGGITCVLQTQFSSINFEVLDSELLHIKFQGNAPSGSGEEDFLRVLPYMGMEAILVKGGYHPISSSGAFGSG